MCEQLHMQIVDDDDDDDVCFDKGYRCGEVVVVCHWGSGSGGISSSFLRLNQSTARASPCPQPLP